MATDKKGFVLYADQIGLFELLSDEEAGVLIKHIFNYVNDKNPVLDNKIIELAFIPIKQQLKRDLIKWTEFREKQSVNGKLGGRPKKPKPLNENPSLLKNTQKSLTVNVNDNVNVTVNDNVNDIKYYRTFKHLKITFEDFDKLVGLGYSKEQVDSILDSIENYKKNTNYTSLYLTASKWLLKEAKDKPVGKMQNFLNNYEIAKNL